MTDFFVDLAAGSSGAGTFASPWNRFTSISGVTAGVDTVWVRRTTYVDTSVHINYAPPNGVPLVGWPTSTDEDYAVRPVIAQAAWDGDVGTHATIDMTDASQNSGTRMIMFVGGITVILKRIQLIYRANSSIGPYYNSHGCFACNSGGANISFYRCNFKFIPVGTFTTNLQAAQNGALLWNTDNSAFVANTAFSARECLFECGVDASGYGVNNGWVAPISGGMSDGGGNYLNLYPGFSDCTLRLSMQATNERWISSAGGFNVRFNGNFVRCTFENLVARTGGNDMLGEGNPAVDFSGTNPRPSFTDCTFTTVISPPGTARLCCGNARFVRCSALNFQSLYAGVKSEVHFTSFIQGAPENVFAGGLHSNSPGVGIVIDSLILQPGNTRDIYMEPGYNCAVVARNIIEGTGGYSPCYANSRVMLANINNAVGTWKSIAGEGTLETSSSTRVGGEAFCMVMRPAAGGGTWPNQAKLVGLRMAWPGEDTIFVSLAAGARTVTVFGYYGGYTVAPTKADVWLEVEYPTTTGLLRVLSRATGTLTADSSTWNGFSGGTPFKMVVSFTPPADCVGTIRISTVAFETSAAYIAIDPKPTVT